MRFLLVDDHELIRMGLRMLIRKEYAEVIIDEADNADAVLQLLKQNQYDLVLLDINFPGSNGLPFFELVRNLFSDLKVIILSCLPGRVYGLRYLQAGAQAYLNKSDTGTDLINAIRTVLMGKRFLTEELIEQITNKTFGTGKTNPFDVLSNREIEIVRHMLDGESQKEIRTNLNLQSSTIGTHKQNIFRKLNVSNILELKDLAGAFSFT